MRYLTSIALVTALITGCGGNKKDDDVDPNTGLTDKQYEMMKAINDSFLNIDSAVTMVSKNGTSNNEKVQKLAELLKSNGCKESGKNEPAETFNSNWKANYTMGSNGGCPLKITKDWDYNGDSLRRTWVYSQQINTQFGDFRDTSEVESLTIDRANMIVTNRSGSQTVDGTFQYTNFVVRDIGLLTGMMRTNQTYSMNRTGGGTIDFRLNSRKDLRVKLLIDFRTGRATTYRINGHQVQPAVVDELFSSFGIMQVKARSEKMLY